MAYLKPQEVRSMNHDDRTSRLYELRQDLVHERGIAAMGGSPPSPGKIRQIRRQIARILTIENEERQGVRGQKPKRAVSPAKPKAPKAKAAAPKKAAPKPSQASKAKAAKPAKASTKAKPKEV